MNSKQQGFSLIELVVAVTLMSIVGLILVQFMGTAVTQSGLPLTMVVDNYEVLEVVETLNADYRERLEDEGVNFDLSAFESSVDNRGHASVSVSTAYVGFNDAGEEIAPGEDTRFLKVKVTKGQNSTTVLYTGK